MDTSVSGNALALAGLFAGLTVAFVVLFAGLVGGGGGVKIAGFSHVQGRFAERLACFELLQAALGFG